MNTRTLALLEEAIEPYRRAGFIVTSQSEGAITLAQPRVKFSYLLFIILLLVWPLAVIYLVSYNNSRQKWVCVRVTSKGQIEEVGYTLEYLEKDRKHTQFAYSIILVILILVLILLTLWILNMTGVF